MPIVSGFYLVCEFRHVFFTIRNQISLFIVWILHVEVLCWRLLIIDSRARSLRANPSIIFSGVGRIGERRVCPLKPKQAGSILTGACLLKLLQ